MSFEFFRKKWFVWLAVIFAFFVFLHLPALHFPYHQDEYKWPTYANPAVSASGIVPHPPLTEFLYRVIGGHIGYDNFRFIPFFFGILNILLLFYLVKTIFDKKTAFWATCLFAVSYYSLLASLMVDVDGAVMPFFFLIMFISYFQLKKRNFQFSIFNFQNLVWTILLIVGAVGGFLVKVVCVIPVAVLAFDFALDKNVFSDKKKIFKSAFYGLVGVVIMILILVFSKFIFPFFNLSYSLKYWEHFVNFGGRNWFQIFIQLIKSVLYASPLLLLPLFFTSKEIFKKARPFFVFLATETVFYLVLFDFSTGALDRYFQFMIVPLCVISAVVFVSIFKTGDNRRNKEYLLLGVLLALFLSLTLFIPQFVPSLYPKKAWISRALSLKWNFLYPFSGGSGPLGFYVSFLFLALSWIISVGLILLGLFKSHLRKAVLLILIPIGLLYNGVFIEEYLFGALYGSAPKLVHNVVQFIKNDQQINFVTVYNDNGGYDIQQIGKYRKRLYTDPAFDINEKIATLNQYKEFYLEINIPRIDPNSVYRKYLDSCKIIYDETDRYISAIVYDCRNAPDVKIND